MTTQISVETLSPITHNQIPVITTELLAQLYGAEVKNIQNNYARNAERFIEGKHFFKVAGDALKNLRVALNYSQNLQPSLRGLQISPKARSLILWTERGAARHAKMLETDQAWEVFEKLEDCYFSQGKTAPTEQQPQIQPQFTAEEIILLCYMQLWMEKAQDLSKQLYPIMKELNSSYTNKLYDIAFETIYMVTKNRDALLREVTRLDMSSSVIQRAMPMLKSLRARQFEF
ncbi:TPA: ORF6N domain-containing protein [Escherichia coli]|uniref:Putative antirepressor protein Ant from prophage n=2 Tax=Escherichia coli TaxID=562 RepID=A0A376M9P2_ECOLX|nr:ORF6N domain-containing protein [Escherichia coli]EIX0888129.1 ORF6N domain-containing protein [Escherichia coli]EKP5774493.1 ORF6N domain-containing protein [Escherichia coli]ELH2288814.1 ORF6N domain-containing protein [Escherichia coli]MBA0934631.1 ORF6N domain-containing protein [Escherichia coli]MCX2397276.1 ORF6N domain-containing protein [Escherichia coli]